ncbi:MAG TPA: glycoside hydrolase family 43 protein, partial [Lachnoclostridium phytofermentans]|nr:glycoside hydrolase family 43 protein [Lachnoclostridium phytofermentans]
MIQNPILRGFCPDPSIIRVGEDYYIATSTFEWWPGIHLFHSKDLKHWEQLPSPITRRSQADMIGNPTSGGIWAPCLSYSDGIFYIVYTDVKTKKGRFYNNHNYLIQSNAIDGEWSEPIYLNSTGFDPSLFHDTDGRKYLVNMRNGFKGILLQEYDSKEQKLVGEIKNIFYGTSYGYTEGPHLYHIGEWYYLITAEGGTGCGHCV